MDNLDRWTVVYATVSICHAMQRQQGRKPYNVADARYDHPLLVKGCPYGVDDGRPTVR